MTLVLSSDLRFGTGWYGNIIAVGGCEPTDPEDPGNLQLDWLEVQLSMFRSRGMQVRFSFYFGESCHGFGVWVSLGW